MNLAKVMFFTTQAMKCATFVVLAFLIPRATGFETKCRDPTIEVKQNGELIGTFRPIASKQDAQGFYAYAHTSFNGNIPTQGFTSNILIHQDARADKCDLNLIIVHDALNSGSHGSAEMTISGDISKAVVRDDPPSDFFGDTYTVAGGKTTIRWNWEACCTDGLAHKLGTDFRGCVTVSANFDTLTSTIRSWRYVAPGEVNVPLDKNLELEICSKFVP